MRPLYLLGLASTLGLVAAGLAAQYAGAFGGGHSTSVVVASHNVEAGLPLTSADLKLVDWPEGSVPPGALRDPSKAVGRFVRQTMVDGEPVLEARLSPVDSHGGLASFVAPGKRAISVKVNEVIAVAGFALPGSFVDILVSAKDSADHPFSKTVLQHVKILAIAQDTQSDPTKPKVVNAVTLELSPAEAEKLDLARNVGTLSLVLRNEFDREEAKSSGVRISDLLANGGQAGDTDIKAAKADAAPQKSAPTKPRPAQTKPAAKPASSTTEPQSRVVELRGLQEKGK